MSIKYAVLLFGGAVLSPAAGAPTHHDPDNTLAAMGSGWAARLSKATENNHEDHAIAKADVIAQGSSRSCTNGNCQNQNCMEEFCNSGCTQDVCCLTRNPDSCMMLASPSHRPSAICSYSFAVSCAHSAGT